MANHQSGCFSIQEAFHPLQHSFILLDATSVAQAVRRALSPAKWGDIDLLLGPQTDQRTFFCPYVFVSFLVLCTFFETPAQFALWGNFGPLAWRENSAIAKEGVISKVLYNPPSAPKTATLSINYTSPFCLSTISVSTQSGAELPPPLSITRPFQETLIFVNVSSLMASLPLFLHLLPFLVLSFSFSLVDPH